MKTVKGKIQGSHQFFMSGNIYDKSRTGKKPIKIRLFESMINQVARFL